MQKKKFKQIILLIIFIIFCVISTKIHDSLVYTEMPNIKDMILADAIGILEYSKVIEDDSFITQLYIIDSETKEKIDIETFDEYQKYIVVDQNPEAGMKFKYRPGVFRKNGVTDIASITVEKERSL